jgi:hypothetical protein
MESNNWISVLLRFRSALLNLGDIASFFEFVALN